MGFVIALLFEGERSKLDLAMQADRTTQPACSVAVERAFVQHKADAKGALVRLDLRGFLHHVTQMITSALGIVAALSVQKERGDLHPRLPRFGLVIEQKLVSADGLCGTPLFLVDQRHLVQSIGVRGMTIEGFLKELKSAGVISFFLIDFREKKIPVISIWPMTDEILKKFFSRFLVILFVEQAGEFKVRLQEARRLLDGGSKRGSGSAFFALEPEDAPKQVVSGGVALVALEGEACPIDGLYPLFKVGVLLGDHGVEVGRRRIVNEGDLEGVDGSGVFLFLGEQAAFEVSSVRGSASHVAGAWDVTAWSIAANDRFLLCSGLPKIVTDLCLCGSRRTARKKGEEDTHPQDCEAPLVRSKRRELVGRLLRENQGFVLGRLQRARLCGETTHG